MQIENNTPQTSTQQDKNTKKLIYVQVYSRKLRSSRKQQVESKKINSISNIVIKKLIEYRKQEKDYKLQEEVIDLDAINKQIRNLQKNKILLNDSIEKQDQFSGPLQRISFSQILKKSAQFMHLNQHELQYFYCLESKLGLLNNSLKLEVDLKLDQRFCSQNFKFADLQTRLFFQRIILHHLFIAYHVKKSYNSNNKFYEPYKCHIQYEIFPVDNAKKFDNLYEQWLQQEQSQIQTINDKDRNLAFNVIQQFTKQFDYDKIVQGILKTVPSYMKNRKKYGKRAQSQNIFMHPLQSISFTQTRNNKAPTFKISKQEPRKELFDRLFKQQRLSQNSTASSNASDFGGNNQEFVPDIMKSFVQEKEQYQTEFRKPLFQINYFEQENQRSNQELNYLKKRKRNLMPALDEMYESHNNHSKKQLKKENLQRQQQCFSIFPTTKAKHQLPTLKKNSSTHENQNMIPEIQQIQKIPSEEDMSINKSNCYTLNTSNYNQPQNAFELTHGEARKSSKGYTQRATHTKKHKCPIQYNKQCPVHNNTRQFNHFDNQMPYWNQPFKKPSVLQRQPSIQKTFLNGFMTQNNQTEIFQKIFNMGISKQQNDQQEQRDCFDYFLQNEKTPFGEFEYDKQLSEWQ